jgi:hypothetical protein
VDGGGGGAGLALLGMTRRRTGQEPEQPHTQTETDRRTSHIISFNRERRQPAAGEQVRSWEAGWAECTHVCACVCVSSS